MRASSRLARLHNFTFYILHYQFNKVVFALGVVLATLYGGSKGIITYPRTDPEVWYLQDSGSYVTNDAVHVAFTRNLIVPATAWFFLYGLECSYTNQGDWAEHSFCAYSNRFESMSGPFDFAYPNATNFNWIGFTDWTPPPTVHTNGVAFVAWQIGAAKPTNDVAMIRTGVYADAVRAAPNPAVTNGLATVFTLQPTIQTTQTDE